MSDQLGPLFLGKRVLTDLGEGEVVEIRNAHDVVPPHGRPTRGIAWIKVRLDRGGSRAYKRVELKDVPP